VNVIKTQDQWFVSLLDGTLRGPFAEEPHLTTQTEGATPPPPDGVSETTVHVGPEVITVRQTYEKGTVIAETFV
jgi:hypothetical protein